MFKALFELWLIGGIILTSVIIISIGIFLLVYFNRKIVSFDEYMNIKRRQNQRYNKARNQHRRPVYEST